MLLSSAAGSPAEHDASGALSLHPLSGARIIRNPLGGLSSLERDGSARILASCDADGRLISLTDSAGTSGLVRRGSFSYALVDGRETLAGVPFPAGRFVRDAHGNTRILHFVSDHIGTPRAVIRNGNVAARLDLMPSGVTLSSSGFDELHGDADRLRFAGKEDLSGPSLGLLPLLDFGARLYDPVSLAWDSPDPLADKYPSLSPYAYCKGDPVNFRDPDGLAWYYDQDGNFIYQNNDDDDNIYILNQEQIKTAEMSKDKNKAFNDFKDTYQYSNLMKTMLDNGSLSIDAANTIATDLFSRVNSDKNDQPYTNVPLHISISKIAPRYGQTSTSLQDGYRNLTFDPSIFYRGYSAMVYMAHELGHIVDFEDSINRGLKYEAEHFADEFVFQYWVWEEINLLYPESKAISDILDHYKNPVTLH